MGPTPLYDALRAFADENPLRGHMPGHKGRAMPLPELTAAAALDFTELTPTGDLFTGEGPIREAEGLWAKAFHMERCLFLTGGSSQGVLTALTLATQGNPRREGGESPRRGPAPVLLDRGSHRSAYNALALLDLEPVYLARPTLARSGLPGPVDPRAVEAHLQKRPDIKTVCITSPTYYGVLSDIPALAAVVHAHGGVLVVDAAHGAHLPFLGDFALASADLAVVSAHKTLPALGQGALLCAGAAFSHGALRRAAALYGSSSPSYLLMASLDAARAWMEDEGGSAYRETARAVARLRARFPALSDGDAPLDGGRLVVEVPDGFAAQKALEALGIYPEMADRGHLVFILTCADGEADFRRLEAGLAGLGLDGGRIASPVCNATRLPEAPPPEVALSPRAALFSCTQTLPLAAAEGRIAACQLAPYPPGVPVVVPGERIGKKHLAYLHEIGYNMEQDVQVVTP